jgi:hypothetical protein
MITEQKMKMKMKKQVYLVLILRGEYKSPEDGGTVTEVIGIYDSASKAEKVCLNENYVVMPIEMNKTCTDEEMVENGYYPTLKENK